MGTSIRTLFDYGDDDKRRNKSARGKPTTESKKVIAPAIQKDCYLIQEMLREKHGNIVDITVKHIRENKIYSDDMKLIAEHPVYRGMVYHMVLDRISPKKNKGKQILAEYIIERANGEYIFSPPLSEINN
jgi:hypothetical protein